MTMAFCLNDFTNPVQQGTFLRFPPKTPVIFQKGKSQFREANVFDKSEGLDMNELKLEQIFQRLVKCEFYIPEQDAKPVDTSKVASDFESQR